MAVSKAQQKAVNKYMATNYDRINLTVAKGQRDTIKAHASTRGKSVNGFIGRAILETMERDSAGAAAEAGVVSLLLTCKRLHKRPQSAQERLLRCL